MSDHEPTKPYVYQPDGILNPSYPRIYALSGPGVPPEHQGMRYTKDEAQAILAHLLAQETL